MKTLKNYWKNSTKHIAKILILTLVLASALPFTACNREDDSGYSKPVDSSKSQLYISNYDGGYGTAWLEALATEFEATYADTVFETGKKGVQIHIDPSKTGMEGTISSNYTANIIFNEHATSTLFYDYQSSLMDLTDVMDEILEQDGVSIDQTYIDAISVGGKIYGIPHYQGTGGFVYDKDLFNEKLFYIAKNGDWCDASGDLAAGPDGQEGTPDDGLPATWEEFFALCDRMKKRNVTPFIISGANRTSYMELLLDRIATAYDGRDITIAKNTLDYEGLEYVTDLTADSDAFGGYTLVTSTADITDSNGYLMRQTEGTYYALSVWQQLIGGSYYDVSGWSSTISHLDAQDLFIRSTMKSQQIGMLLDGTWWENEATDAFATMEGTNTKYSKQNRNFGWLPMPTKVDAEDTNVGDSQLGVDSLRAFCVAKKNSSEEMTALIKEFIKFAYTEEHLADFTEITNCPRVFDYSISDEVYNNMSNFSKEIWDLKKNGKFVCTFTSNSTIVNNSELYTDRWVSATYRNSTIAFYETKVDAKAYFLDNMISESDWISKYGPFN